MKVQEARIAAKIVLLIFLLSGLEEDALFEINVTSKNQEINPDILETTTN